MSRSVRIVAHLAAISGATVLFVLLILTFIHASIRNSDAVTVARSAVMGKPVTGVGVVTSTEFPRLQQMKLRQGFDGGGFATFVLELKGPQGTTRHRFLMSKASKSPWTIDNPLPN